MRSYKYLNPMIVWNVLFGVICIPTAGKMIDVAGIPISISIYYFPFIYIFGDILTEVYGYAEARRVLWYSVAAQIVATLVFQFVVFYPPSSVMVNNQSYVDVLSAAPQIVLFGTMAMFLGDIVNNYVVAKMKVWTKGKLIAVRFVMSTVCGQIVNTGFFYVFGLWGMLPLHSLFASILAASLMKVIFELVLLPVTIKVSGWLKKVEGVDYYDQSTDFNPLKF